MKQKKVLSPENSNRLGKVGEFVETRKKKFRMLARDKKVINAIEKWIDEKCPD